MIKIGCCGFARGREEYFKHFKLIEIQQTFYKIVPERTLKSWYQGAPSNFEFTVKAFQGLTHPIKSPTWKRSGIELKGNERYGDLQPSDEVYESWNITRKACEILNSRICLIQLPKRFKDQKENIKNAENFFSGIDRRGVEIAIELRGWSDENIERLCRDYNLIDCRDPFVSLPVYLDEIAYFRLHGSPPGDKMYNYKYKDDELFKLRDILTELECREIYVLFNNKFMFDDAIRFKEIIKKEEEGWGR